MLYPPHLRRFVIVPALATLPEPMRSPAAVELLLGTALKESKLTVLKQGVKSLYDGRGRALGIYQMETATYRDHLRWLQAHPDLQAIILPHGARPATAMQGDLFFATQMARIHYWSRGRDALPDADDIEGLAAYWGRWWQTQSIPHQMGDFVSLYQQYAMA